MHGQRTPREKIVFTARPKIQSQSQIFRYGQSIFCLPHKPKFSDLFDLCLHWVSVVRGKEYYKLFHKGGLRCQTRVVTRALHGASAHCWFLRFLLLISENTNSIKIFCELTISRHQNMVVISARVGLFHVLKVR